jgi:glycosyltransferase involved in cell wall biosynthesis
MTPKTAPISVLMSSYFRDDPGHLRMAMKSLTEQTVQPDEVVIVTGGELPPALRDVLDNFAREALPIHLNVAAQKDNEGLGSALQQGMRMCRNEFVARMDSDDVCHPTRFEKQIAFMRANPGVDILCSWHEEFESDPSLGNALKCTPATHKDIVARLWWRNVISHPTIFLRKSRVQDIGGYRPFRRSEDHDLWLRAASHGLVFASIQEPLLSMRVDRSQRVRRTGSAYAFTSVAWRARMLAEGHISPLQFLISAPLYFGFHMVPPHLKDSLYRLVRRPPPAQTRPSAV